MDFIDQYLSVIDLPLGLSLAGVFVTLVTTLLRSAGTGWRPGTTAGMAGAGGDSVWGGGLW